MSKSLSLLANSKNWACRQQVDQSPSSQCLATPHPYSLRPAQCASPSDAQPVTLPYPPLTCESNMGVGENLARRKHGNRANE